jgi:hypothetical protein
MHNRNETLLLLASCTPSPSGTFYAYLPTYLPSSSVPTHLPTLNVPRRSTGPKT